MGKLSRTSDDTQIGSWLSLPDCNGGRAKATDKRFIVNINRAPDGLGNRTLERSGSRNGGGRETHSFRPETKRGPIIEKTKYSNSFKYQAQLGSFFPWKGNSEKQRFPPFSTSTPASMTQTKLNEENINRLTFIFEVKQKTDMPERLKSLMIKSSKMMRRGPEFK